MITIRTGRLFFYWEVSLEKYLIKEIGIEESSSTVGNKILDELVFKFDGSMKIKRCFLLRLIPSSKAILNGSNRYGFGAFMNPKKQQELLLELRSRLIK